MAVCERCGKEEGEWQCQVCRRLIGENCARPTAQGVFCVDHVPVEGVKPKAKTSMVSAGSGIMKSLFITMLFLTLGLGLIVMIGDFFINMIEVPTGAPGFAQDIINLITRVRGSGTLILLGMGALTAVLGIAWLSSRKAS
jgi:hypothetical protein